MQILTADQAASLLKDGDTLMIGGSGSGHAVPEALIEALERRFLAQGEPRRITSFHPVGLGDRGERGASRLAHTGLLKRVHCRRARSRSSRARWRRGGRGSSVMSGCIPSSIRAMAVGFRARRAMTNSSA
jgi:acyl CoA:acetate/3-ketoacid CoA transferase